MMIISLISLIGIFGLLAVSIGFLFKRIRTRKGSRRILPEKILAGYSILLLCSILVFALVPAHLKNVKYPYNDDYPNEEKEYEQFMNGLKGGTIDKLSTAIMKKEWDFPYSKDSFDVKTMGWNEGDPFILVDDRGEGDRITVQHIVSRSIVQNWDITSEVPSPEVSFKEGILKVKGQPEKTITINQYNSSFVTKQFKGKPVFEEGMYESTIGTDTIYITVPKETLVSGPVEWVRDLE